jgi:hypothetical protein
VQNAQKVSVRGPMPAGPLPGWITADVIAETRAVWQPFYEKELTNDEIVDLLLNVGTLFRILRRRPDEETIDSQ